MIVTDARVFKALSKLLSPKDVRPELRGFYVNPADSTISASDGLRLFTAKILGPDEDFPPMEPCVLIPPKLPARYKTVEVVAGGLVLDGVPVACESVSPSLMAAFIERTGRKRLADGRHVAINPVLLADVCKALGCEGVVLGLLPEGNCRVSFVAPELPEYTFLVQGLGKIPAPFYANLE